MVTEIVNTPGVSDINLSVDTVQVQNNDAEQSISITDNALHVTNANNGLENIKKTEQQAQPSVSQITNDNTVVRQAGSTRQQPVVIVDYVRCKCQKHLLGILPGKVIRNTSNGLQQLTDG